MSSSAKPVVVETPPSQPTPVPGVKIDALKTADAIKKDFLTSHYYYAKQQPLDGIKHVIIYHNARLSLLEKKFDGSIVEREEKPTPALQTAYSVVKSIAHLSVWLTIVLDSIVAKDEQNNKHKEALLSIKTHLALLRKCDDKFIDSEFLVIDKMSALVDEIMKASSINEIKKIQKQFLSEIAVVNMRYAKKATELQLTGMHEIVNVWLEQYKLNLNNTRVLIVCAHGPKQDLIETQYFTHLYKQFGLIHAEYLGYIIPVPMLTEQLAGVSQEHLINFLRKHEMNKLIGKSMLDDPTAMNRDVLGPHAPSVLEKPKCPFHQLSSYVMSSLFPLKQKETCLSSTESVHFPLK